MEVADAILFFTTSTTPGSSELTELCDNFDVYISDEAAKIYANYGATPLHATTTRMGQSGSFAC